MSLLVSRSPRLAWRLCAGMLALTCGFVDRSWAQQASPAQSGAPSDTEAEDTPASDAAPTRQQCIAAHRASQKDTQEGRLMEARGRAKLCTHRACPGLLVTDCAAWLEQLDERIPSVVFEVRLDGRTVFDATIYADDDLVADWTRGEALQLDPGRHTFRVILPKHGEKTQTLLLAEGMRFLVVSANFETERASAPATRPAIPLVPRPSQANSPNRTRPVPFIVYPLLGAGGLGLVGFAGFGLWGKAEKQRLEQDCAPNCTSDDLTTMHRRFLYADISLGVGAAALVGAGIAYLTRPERHSASNVGLTLLPTGGTAVLASGTF
jgi:hypothetical protein